MIAWGPNSLNNCIHLRSRLHAGMKNALFTAVLLATLAALVACHGDRVESFYPTLAHAKNDMAVDRGWIPSFLPESSYNIHELHELSPSRGWCAFEFRANDSQELRKNLSTVEVLPESVKKVRDPGRPWWPGILTGDVDGKKIRSAGFELYVRIEPATPSTSQAWLFAVDWRTGRGYFYSTPG